ncbi:MAG TPA: chemotaxis response regulator protein-glutamate methylesterase [Burkholderiales bacterium]|nr:chemotaxis response regulator protein-glutamate methylesterase [Burkholderiales bacterium]
MDRIRVLVVDDSAVMRGIMSRIINAQPDMTVAAVASDPLVAMERLRTAPPDVIALDVEMPRMDGLQFLARLMQWRPTPVVMVSSLTAQGAETTLRALELGAVDFVAKPLLAGGREFEDYAQEVAEKLRAAAGARVGRRPGGAAAAGTPKPRQGAAGGGSRDQVIVIGASTGGVEALREVLVPLPCGMPPILVAQHMPAGFTRSFAQRLDALCQVEVKEGEDGEPLRRGHAYIAPGGRHLELCARAGKLEARLTQEPPVNRHRPSVDTLFRSAAQAAAARCIGVMLSGMGADGADAMLELRRRGARNIAQDEASCVVYGMPKQAVAAGAVHELLPLREIPSRLIELCLANG